MKYLVTGLTGFAAPHLANLLIDEGHEVVGLIRCSNGREESVRELMDDAHFSKITWVYCDLTDLAGMLKIFTDHQLDGVFHLAAQSHPPTSFTNPLETFDANIMGSANLIYAISTLQPKCRLMFCSTSEVYGNLASDVGILKETLGLLPANPYGVSKAAIDLYMQERTKNKYIDGFVTRAFSHTGPGRGRRFSISSDA
jgi:GDP-D-mannose dehydratase